MICCVSNFKSLAKILCSFLGCGNQTEMYENEFETKEFFKKKKKKVKV